MPACGISLVDANVWLALAVDAHVHHAEALAWFNAQSDASCAFCRITQMALLRHLTNVKIMGAANVQSQTAAWASYDALLSDPRVLFLDEGPGTDSAFRTLTQSADPAHDKWTDAYLAAVAESMGCFFTTFDQGFQRFANITIKLLGVVPPP